MSSKVTVFGANRKRMEVFLFVTNSNLGSISHRFCYTLTYWPKMQIFPTPS